MREVERITHELAGTTPQKHSEEPVPAWEKVVAAGTEGSESALAASSGETV